MKRKDKPEKKKTQSPKIRKLKKIIVLALAAVILLGALGTAGFFTLFRVRNIQVFGEIPYSRGEITDAGGIHGGDNLFLVNLEKAASDIELKLPHTDNVEAVRKLPSTIVYNVSTSVPVFSLLMPDGSYVLANDKLKAIDISVTPAEDSIIIDGGDLPQRPTVGKKISFILPSSGGEDNGEEKPDKVADAIIRMMNGSHKDLMGKVSLINVENSDGISLVFDRRIIIRLGDGENIDSKLTLAAKAMESEDVLSSLQYGELSIYSGGKAVFSPKNYKDMTALAYYLENGIITDGTAVSEPLPEETEGGEQTGNEDENGSSSVDENGGAESYNDEEE